MENQRNFLFIALLAISAVLYTKWLEFSAPKLDPQRQTQSVATLSEPGQSLPVEQTTTNAIQNGELPSTPSATASVLSPSIPKLETPETNQALITVNTDLLRVEINPQGGVIERVELKDQPIEIDQPEQGYPLLKNETSEKFLAEDGLLASGAQAPNHVNTLYYSSRQEYQLTGDEVKIPLSWTSPEGVSYIKTFTFNRNSYVINIDYTVENRSENPWNGYLYAQFSRSEPKNTGGGFGQLPSFTGGASYTEEQKYEKIDFDEMGSEPLTTKTNNGWVAMLQHYFVGAWIPADGSNKEFYSTSSNSSGLPMYRIGFKTTDPVQAAPNSVAHIGTNVYIGSKEQSRLKDIQQRFGIAGLALTVDYGFLTFIADPLFSVLSFIHGMVGNWGWAIILLTILIKIVFYPLSAASFRSMAGMKKLQPRIQTLKDRYKDDKQKFQMEMMALYKKEKINPAGGCLPILIQIPVFIALYWVLLESVEMRHAPFALWLQDLSAKDPYYILPVLMGVSMWAQQKLNPAPMDDIQKKVFAIMPIALTFLFLTFPQGLVLYWVVNNILQMAQQWFVYRQIDKANKAKS